MIAYSLQVIDLAFGMVNYEDLLEYGSDKSRPTKDMT